MRRGVGRLVPAVVVGMLAGAALWSGVRLAPWWAETVGLQGSGRLVQGRLESCANPEVCLSPSTLSGDARDLLLLVAGARAANGCPDVVVDARLTRAAQELADRQTQPAGSQPGPAGTPGPAGAGYPGRVEQVVAQGVESPRDAVRFWTDADVDPLVRRRLLDCTVTGVGVGYPTDRPSDRPADGFGGGYWLLLGYNPLTR